VGAEPVTADDDANSFNVGPDEDSGKYRLLPFRVWDVLARVDHPVLFERLVDDQRSAGRMVNDDVTLLRVHLDVGPPACLVSCLS
jgi:hypothetical protein